MYLQGSIHAVSSFRVLTDGRLTAVCPRNGKIPTRGSTSNTIWGAANLQRTKYKARSNRICCELNSTGIFQKDLFKKTFLLSVFELKTNCGSLLCNDFQHSKYQQNAPILAKMLSLCKHTALTFLVLWRQLYLLLQNSAILQIDPRIPPAVIVERGRHSPKWVRSKFASRFASLAIFRPKKKNYTTNVSNCKICGSSTNSFKHKTTLLIEQTPSRNLLSFSISNAVISVQMQI